MKQLLLLTALLITSNLFAQNNVGIGTTTPNTKAILELQATDKGLLTPRMNTVQMNAIGVTPAENALLIYNTDSACYHFYNGVAWKNLCQKGIDTAVINSAIKNYLGGVTFTTVINNMLVDSSVTNYAVINNAIVNNITIDSSVINYTTIDNATINNLTVDSSSINFTTINNAVINNLTVDSSYTNVSNSNISNINIANIDTSITNVATINNATINNLTSDSTISNYSNINNAIIDSSVTNYSQVSHLQGGWGSMDSLQIGGQNIMQTMSDSIKSQAWLLKGNAGTNATTHFLGTTDNKSLRIRTNNMERMIIDSIGNVGIGTNTHSTKVSVRFPSDPAGTNLTLINAANDALTNARTFQLQIENPNNIVHQHPLVNIESFSDVHATAHFSMRRARGTIANPTPALSGDNLGFVGFYAKTTDPNPNSYAWGGGMQNILRGDAGPLNAKTQLNFYVNDSTGGKQAMTINYNSNVGIGTNTPIAKAEINGYTVSQGNVITPVWQRGNTILLAPNTPTGSYTLFGTGSITDGTMSSYIDLNNTTSYVDIDVPAAAQWGINGNNFYVSIAGHWHTDLQGGSFKLELYDGNTSTWVTLATNLTAGIHYITNTIPGVSLGVNLPQLRLTPVTLGGATTARISEFEVFATLPYGGYNFAADKIQVNTGMSFGTSAGAGMLSNNSTNFGGLSNGCNSYSLNWHNPSTATGWAGSISSNGSNGLIASTLGATAGDVPFAVTSGVYNSLLNTRTNDNLLIVKGDGSVGIGTNNPSAPLHLHSPNPNFHALRFTNENTTDHWDLVKRGQTYGAGANNNFTFAFNGGEMVNIAPNGYVGILATTPIAPLHINGNYGRSGGDSGPYDPLHASNAIFDRLIGAYTGGAAEHVSFAINSQPLARMGISATVNAGNLDAPNSIFYINTDPSVNNAWINPKFVIQGTTGNVGIGLSGAPVAPLHVATPAVGNRVMTLQAGGLAFHYNILTTYGSFTNPDGILYVDFGGNENYMMGGTLIGDGGSGFRDLGLAVQRWNTLYCANAPDISSDMRLKTNITPVKFGLNEVTKMNPVSYNWNKENVHRGEKLHLGFLAQELKELVPTVVHEDEKGMLSVTYTELIPVLVNAIKEQQQQIDALKTKPNNENEKIKLLEDQIQQLKQQNETILKLLQERK
jgi:hypothetical protein